MPDRRESFIHERFIHCAYEHARLHEDDACTVLEK